MCSEFEQNQRKDSLQAVNETIMRLFAAQGESANTDASRWDIWSCDCGSWRLHLHEEQISSVRLLNDELKHLSDWKRHKHPRSTQIKIKRSVFCLTCLTSPVSPAHLSHLLGVFMWCCGSQFRTFITLLGFLDLDTRMKNEDSVHVSHKLTSTKKPLKTRNQSGRLKPGLGCDWSNFQQEFF